MKYLVLVLLSPLLLGSISVVSTEVEYVLSPEVDYQLSHMAYSSDFQSIPSNPNVFTEVDTYRDKELTVVARTIRPHESIVIRSAVVNDQSQLVFELAEGDYLPANRELVYDDLILEKRPVEQTVWLQGKTRFLSTPVLNQASTKESGLLPYQAVEVTELAQTPLGQFANIEDKGWLPMEELSTRDNRMDVVQDLLESKYQKDTVGVYVKLLSSGETAGLHASKQMYSASIAKLPLLYYVQQEVDKGRVKLTDTVAYTKDVSEFKGSYQASGSGSLPKEADNNTYSIHDLMERVARESDNVASNILAYHVAGKYGHSYQTTLSTILDQEWDMAGRLASPKMAGQVMEALYEQDGLAIQALQNTQFDNQRISRDIPVPVAHKIGDADEFRHDVALVYAKEPFVLSIFTAHEDYELISQIANDVYRILQ